MGNRRKNAKTGDSAIYKARRQVQESGASDTHSDEDAMHNEIDRYHARLEHQEFLRLDGPADSEEEVDDGISKREGILDLGGGESSSSSGDDDSSDEAEPAGGRDAMMRLQVSSPEGEDELSDSESEIVENEDSDIRNWGRKKSAYYHGDTADLEIGQDEEDAFVEEEAAKEVLAARYAYLDEDDFGLSDAEDDEKVEEKQIDELRRERDLSKLSRSERRRLLRSHHPELIPLVSHFAYQVRDWNDRTRVVEDALGKSDGDEAATTVGATPHGMQLLVTKSLLQTSTALNTAIYLLLKVEQSSQKSSGKLSAMEMNVNLAEIATISSHPVVERLQRLNHLSKKLQDSVVSKLERLDDQVENLVKASALIASGGFKKDDDEDPLSNDEMSKTSEEQEQKNETSVSEPPLTLDPASSAEDEKQQEVMNDARFGLRMDELVLPRKRTCRLPATADFGDEQDDISVGKATRALASTVNYIEQRSKTKSRKRRAMPVEEQFDETNDDLAGFHSGLEMMDEELGRLESDEAREGKADELDDELDVGQDNDDYYDRIAKKSRLKKSFKRELYKVAPKYPGIDAEVDGERAISQLILKNRGLVAHKSKLNRNPRVKKREQYRRALVRRKGAVREVRTGEGHKYGGEETGIKIGLSRSRKLAPR